MKTFKIIILFFIIFFNSTLNIFASNEVTLGLHVGNINTGTYVDADKIINTVINMKVPSVRIIYQKPKNKSTTAYVVKQLNSRGIDVLITILPDASDYSSPSTSYSNYPNGSVDFEKLCGSPGWKWMYKYSTVDQSLYRQRLTDLLNEINRMGGVVSAFEVGNEADWACFNGDIPVVATNNTDKPYDLSRTDFLSGTVKGYAYTLKTSYETIKSLHPQAKVLTFGAANMYLFDPKKPHIHYPNFLLWLTNIGGVNYLTKYSDATAMHFYPQDPTLRGIEYYIGPALTNVTKYRNRFWITEFGFGKTLPSYSGNSNTIESQRLQSYSNFMSVLNNLNQVIVERAYLYSYEPGIWSITENDKPLESANIFKIYSQKPLILPKPTLMGDLNNDNVVNKLDFNLLLSGLGSVYNLTDFNNIVSNYGKTSQ